MVRQLLAMPGMREVNSESASESFLHILSRKLLLSTLPARE